VISRESTGLGRRGPRLLPCPSPAGIGSEILRSLPSPDLEARCSAEAPEVKGMIDCVRACAAVLREGIGGAEVKSGAAAGGW
jgi:hypothetical protein